MLRLRILASKLSAFFRKGSLDRDFDEEMAAHLQLAVDDFIAQGMSPREAQRRARIEFGGAEGAKELHRDTRGLPQLDMLLQDLRFSLRSLRRDWGFALISVLILGLGIGATTTVFSVVDAVLLEPLPFAEADRLAWISHTPKEGDSGGLSERAVRVGLFEEWQERSQSFEALSAYNAFFAFGSHRLNSGPEPARLVGVRIAQNLFDVLGIAPHLGRTFDDHEVLPGGPMAVILSHRLWQTQFESDAEIVGQTVLLDDQAVLVTGVMPAELDFGAIFSPGVRVDLFTPLRFDELRNWGNTLAVVGRLRPGVTAAAAHRELEGVTAVLTEIDPRLAGFIDAKVVPLTEEVHGSSRRSLFILFACVGAVLLIACANISNLQLVRSSSRRKEFAIRSALGAGRPRVLRQLLTESLLLSGLGAALGLAITYSATEAISSLQGINLPLLYRVEVDAMTLFVTSAIAVAAGLVFGLAPALSVTFLRVQENLKEGARGSTIGAWQQRARSSLVILETALACTLLVGAGLLARSFLEVLEVDLGFEPHQALTVNVDTGTGSDSALRQEQTRILVDAVTAVAGVQSASLTDALPLDRNRTWGIAPAGTDPEAGKFHGTFIIHSGADYLRTMGIPLIAGRDFDKQDREDSSPVAIINQSLARRLFPSSNPIGQAVTTGRRDRTVIGVAADVRHGGVEQPGGLETYLPIAQSQPSALELVVRTRGEPTELLGTVRDALRRADPTLPLTDLRPLSSLVHRAVSLRRFFLSLILAFAAFAVVLAGLGIYGVISYTVGQRAGEIGIRMALGASRNQVRLRVLRETLALAGLGIAVGALGAIVLARTMSSLLFGIEAMDPMTFATALLSSILIALAAGSLPASRAGRVDPLSALRES